MISIVFRDGVVRVSALLELLTGLGLLDDVGGLWLLLLHNNILLTAALKARAAAADGQTTAYEKGIAAAVADAREANKQAEGSNKNVDQGREATLDTLTEIVLVEAALRLDVE